MSALLDASRHLSLALEHHDADRYSAARRALKNAQAAVNRALAEAPPAAHDSITNPAAATGAQVSNGQAPRSLDPEIRRQQDQLRSCQIAYDLRQKRMRGGR